MNAPGNDTELGRDVLAIGAWEHEGGALAHDWLDHEYGVRIETGRSWTIYHEFTVVPARVGARTMAALIAVNPPKATDSMLSLNQLTARRRKKRSGLPSRFPMLLEAACQP